MATLASLREEVIDLIQDNGYASAADNRIKNFLNNGIDEIAYRYRLPSLECSSTVTTSSTAASVALPTNYHSGLARCYSETSDNNLAIYPGLRWMLEKYDGAIDETGEIESVAIQGNNLLYQPLATETLRLYYQQSPTYLSSLDDIETNLPPFLCRDLLVNYACWRYFERAEDGLDGQKVNTAYYAQRYELALTRLEGHLNQRVDPTWVKPSAWI